MEFITSLLPSLSLASVKDIVLRCWGRRPAQLVGLMVAPCDARACLNPRPD